MFIGRVFQLRRRAHESYCLFVLFFSVGKPGGRLQLFYLNLRGPNSVGLAIGERLSDRGQLFNLLARRGHIAAPRRSDSARKMNVRFGPSKAVPREKTWM